MMDISELGRENEKGKSVNEEEEEIGYRNSGGKRWPQQETMDLLRIRSEMDVAFREPGSKTHLWDELSRRMLELGYHRTAKKCKEKFENIYKYHRRLKNSSFARPTPTPTPTTTTTTTTNTKTYRFFHQLEALGHQHPCLSFPPHTPTPTTLAPVNDGIFPISQSVPQMDSFTISTSTTSTPSPSPSNSATHSKGGPPKKRKWQHFFHLLTNSVLERQEALQNKFLETIDKCERHRQAREDAWKLQEIDRINREQELLMQERSISAAKDAAVLAFLHKFSQQPNFPGISGPMLQDLSQQMNTLSRKQDDHAENSTSRWPKEQVEALIKIKTNLESDYQRFGPKGPMWEEISMAMKSFGYDRNAKRCKEKWENINKYYRRVKDSNKHRHVDSKACPYFHLLDNLYNMKAKRLDNNISENSSTSNLKPEELLLHMMNHHSRQQQQEQLVLQHNPGELIMQIDKHTCNEEAGNEVAEHGLISSCFS